MLRGTGLCIFIFFLGELSSEAEILWMLLAVAAGAMPEFLLSVQLPHPLTPGLPGPLGEPSHLIERAVGLQVKCGNLARSPREWALSTNVSGQSHTAPGTLKVLGRRAQYPSILQPSANQSSLHLLRLAVTVQETPGKSVSV